MILDDLKNAASYHGLGERFERAFEHLRTTDFAQLSEGRHGIEGRDLVAILQTYETKPLEQGRWEAHRIYADIQFMLRGNERMGIAPLHAMTVTEAHDAEKDVAFFNGRGQFIIVESGQFAIFLPQDVHMPTLNVDRPETVTKVVMKVRL